MAAYVKYLEGASKGSKVRVSLSKFKNSFKDNLQFDEKKKYFVQNSTDQYVKAKIIFLESSNEELDKQLAKSSRIREYPDGKLETMSESDGHHQKRLAKSTTGLNKTSDKKEENFKKYASLLNCKNESLKQHIYGNNSKVNNTSNEDQVIEERITLQSPNKNKSCDSSKKDFVTSNPIAEQLQADPNDGVTVENSKTDDESLAIRTQTSDNQLNDSTLSIAEKPEVLMNSSTNKTTKNPAKKNASAKIISAENKTDDANLAMSDKKNDNQVSDSVLSILEIPETSTDSIAKNQTSDNQLSDSTLNIVEEPEELISSSTNKTVKNPAKKNTSVKILAIKKYSNSETYLKNIENLEKQVQSLKKKNQEYKETIAKYEKKYDKIKEDYKQLQQKHYNITKLNEELQSKIIDKFEEKTVIDKQLADNNVTTHAVSAEANFVPIGYYTKSNNMYHIGKGFKVSAAVWDKIHLHSKTPATCVGNILTSIFEETVLISSTMTGRVTNRSRDEQKTEFKVLDSTKVEACKEFYLYWLKNVWAAKHPNSEEKYYVEASKFNTYVSKKLSYLKQPASKTVNVAKSSSDKRKLNKNKITMSEPSEQKDVRPTKLLDNSILQELYGNKTLNTEESNVSTDDDELLTDTDNELLTDTENEDAVLYI